MPETDYTSWKENNAYFGIDDETPISSKNFKKVGDLFDNNKELSSKTRTVTRMKNNKIKSYLIKHLFENHKLDAIKKSSRRTCLTDHTKPYDSSYLYDHIMNYCFNGTDIKSFLKIKKIDQFEAIKQIHKINPSFCGTFFDYLTRRHLCEMRGDEFKDIRVERALKNNSYREDSNTESSDNEALDPDEIESACLERFKEEYRSDRGIFHDKTDVSGNAGKLHRVEIEKIRTINKPVRLAEGMYSPKFCAEHFCLKTGKMYRTNFGCDQAEAYQKCKNISEFKTENILKEIFVVSNAHSEWFDQILPQDKFDQINNIITSLDSNALINHFRNIYTEIIENVPANKIMYNPTCGGREFKCGADADLIIDDCLIDMKVSNGKKENGEILQLLGYAALLRFNRSIIIKNICIFNYLLGEIKCYNIEWITENQLRTYIDLIDGDIYDKTKIVTYSPISNMVGNFPDFMDDEQLEEAPVVVNSTDQNPTENEVIGINTESDGLKNLRLNPLQELCLIELIKKMDKDGCTYSFPLENEEDYYDEEGCPFDSFNRANWDGDQQIGFRDPF